MLLGSSETIVALSSGLPPSAIAVVRASGGAVLALAAAFGVRSPVPRRPTLVAVRSPRDGTVLDRALALYFAAPASATGEDVFELHLHGGPALVERVLSDALTVDGVRAAEPGEFTLRAVINGRMGLPDAEALADLIEARSEAERRRASRLAAGALSQRLEGWRGTLVGALAAVEAQLDFADEGDVGARSLAPDDALVRAREEIATELALSRDADKLTDGYSVALVGAPNAGKSSLFNALVGRDGAIVSDEAGTTRDVVSAVLELGGYRVTLSDTAGLRSGASGVEALGIARSHTTIEAADLVVLVESPDTKTVEPPPRGDIRVRHKADIAPPGWSSGADVVTSLGDPASIATLSNAILGRVRAGLANAEASVLTRARQRSALNDVVAGIDEAAAAHHLELKAEGLRLALRGMGRMTGEIGIEEVLDDVFARFCIGK